MWLKEKLVSWFLKDYLNDYVKPIIEKVIKFFDGKKTILSLIAFAASQCAKAHPGTAVASVLVEILSYLSLNFEVVPSLDGIDAAALIGIAVGFYDKLKKWVSKDKKEEVK
jgi:hypothetical protein